MVTFADIRVAVLQLCRPPFEPASRLSSVCQTKDGYPFELTPISLSRRAELQSDFVRIQNQNSMFSKTCANLTSLGTWERCTILYHSVWPSEITDAIQNATSSLESLGDMAGIGENADLVIDRYSAIVRHANGEWGGLYVAFAEQKFHDLRVVGSLLEAFVTPTTIDTFSSYWSLGLTLPTDPLVVERKAAAKVVGAEYSVTGFGGTSLHRIDKIPDDNGELVYFRNQSECPDRILYHLAWEFHGDSWKAWVDARTGLLIKAFKIRN